MDLINSLYSRPAGLPSTNASDYSSSFNSSNSFSMDPLSLVLGGASSLINLFGQHQTNKTNLKINEMNNRFNEAESYKAYMRQRSLIAEQNQYNSYENQRALMEAAGYNPNSLVGGTAGTAVSTGSTSSTPASAASPLAAQFQKIDLASSYAQLANLQSQRELNEANADKAAADAAATRANTPTGGRNLGDANFDLISANVTNLSNQAKLFDSTFDNQVLNSSLVNSKLSYETDFLKVQYLNLYSRLDMDQQEFEYNMKVRWPAEVEQIVQATKLSKAQCSAAFAQAQLYISQKYLYDAQREGIEINNEYLRKLYSDPAYIKAVKDQAISIARKTAADAVASEKGWPWITIQSGSDSYSAGGYSSSSSYSSPLLPGDIRATDSIPNVQSRSPLSPVPAADVNDAGFVSREYDQYLSSLSDDQLRKLVPASDKDLEGIINWINTDPKFNMVFSSKNRKKSIINAIKANYNASKKVSVNLKSKAGK